MDRNKIYPLTVVCDRYGGAYSGGRYTAWNLDHYNVPDSIHGDDMTCMEFWEDSSQKYGKVGKGSTIKEAMDDLASDESCKFV